MRHARALREEMAEWTGLEPATPGVTGRYSNQLNYHSACWWVLRGSNPRPSPCKGDALPAELSTPLEEGREYTRGSPAWLGACLNISREPRWQGRISVRCSWAWPTPLDPCTGADARRTAPAVVVLRTSRATPQTPQRTDPPARPNTMVALEQSALPTLRDRADFPSCGVVASLLGHYPTASAPPCLRGNLPRSRPREILRQAPCVLLPLWRAPRSCP